MRFEANTSQVATVSVPILVIEFSWAILDDGSQVSATSRDNRRT